MPITEFDIGPTDSDGERRANLEFEITNTYGQDISLVLYSAQYLDTAGRLLGSIDEDSQFCLLENGDSESISSGGYIDNSIVRGSQECLARLQVRFFNRIFAKFGPFDVPEKEGAAHYKISIPGSPLEQEIGGLVNGDDIVVSVSRLRPDDDGEVRINIICGLKNKSKIYSERNEIKISLLDRNGEEIEETTEEKGLPAGAFACFKPRFWGIKQSRLKKASFEIKMAVYQQIGTVEFESSSEISD
jgi:hypothetical protein